jgi:hypothetical protein
MLVLDEPSRQIQAFNVTIEQSDARRRFLFVSDRGQLAGRLYALCALKALDRAEASRLAERLRQVQDTVMLFERGVAKERALADLVPLFSDAAVLAQLKQFRMP